MHVRCQQCQTQIEFVSDFSSESEVVCSSCGSSFKLGPPTKPFSPKSSFLGRFELLNEVGVGSFGAVWKARDSELDRTVAIKIPRTEQIGRADADLFLREARSAAQLKHANIVALHEVGWHGDVLYLVSDFVDGLTLHEWLRTHRAAPREAAELCVKIATALHHAHQAGVIHRDLKPANVMLTCSGPSLADCEPFIMDFGLAKRDAGEVTMTAKGAVLGTAAYMPPEQARGDGHHVDRRADVYSLGVILFELLSGERPFRGNTPMLLHQVIHDEPPSPRRFSGRISRDLETITLKCLEKEPRRRYATAMDVARELRRFLDGEPIEARPVSRTARAWRWAKRKPGLAISTSLTALVLVLGSIFSTFFALQSQGRLADVRQASTELEDNLYFSNIARANAAVTSGDPLLAEEFLRDPPRRLKGWEWHYLNARVAEALTSGRVDASLRADDEHSKAIWSVQALRDGQQWVTAGFDGRLVRWRLTDGKPQQVESWRHGLPFFPALSVAVSADGRYVASGGASFNPFAVEWPKFFRVVLTPPPPGVAQPDARGLGLRVLGFSLAMLRSNLASIYAVASALRVGDSRRYVAAVGTDLLTGPLIQGVSGSITLRDLQEVNGSPLVTRPGHLPGPVLALAFHPTQSGRFAASSWSLQGAAPPVTIWHVDAQARTVELVGSVEVDDHVTSLAYDPAGKTLAAAGLSGVIHLLDAESFRATGQLKGHRGPVWSVAFDPASGQLASAGFDGSIRLWDVARLHETRSLRGHVGPASSVAFGLEGGRLVSTGWDKTVRIWEVEDGREILALRGHRDVATDVAVSADGRTLATVGGGGDPALLFWTTASHDNEARPHARRTADLATCLAFSPLNDMLAFAEYDGAITLARFPSLEPLGKLSGHEQMIGSLAFSPDGKRLLSASWDKSLRLWDIASGGELTGDKLADMRHDHPVSRAAFTPQGDVIVSCSVGGDARRWNAASGRPLTPPLIEHGLPLWDVECATSGRWVAAAGADTLVRLFDVRNGRGGMTIQAHEQQIMDTAFSADARWLATACIDGTVRVWDASSGGLVRELREHRDHVMRLAFHPLEPSLIASASEDGTLLLWRVDTGAAPRRFSMAGAAMDVAFSRDGQWLAAAGGSPGKGELRAWRLDEEPGKTNDERR